MRQNQENVKITPLNKPDYVKFMTGDKCNKYSVLYEQIKSLADGEDDLVANTGYRQRGTEHIRFSR